ncbi:unnamed protein product, partial [Gadus morhua 'NCC']
VQTPIEPSVAQFLQGIGPGGLACWGKSNLPVTSGRRATNVNFIMADTAESTEVILGHPFLYQTSARLDYGCREITLCGVEVAHIIVQAQRSTSVPIRVFNPGALPVTLKRGAVAGILQPSTLLENLDPSHPSPHRS